MCGTSVMIVYYYGLYKMRMISLLFQVKVKLPVELKPSHHLLFTFSHVACDVQKATKAKSSVKLPPVESVGTYVNDLHCM